MVTAPESFLRRQFTNLRRQRPVEPDELRGIMLKHTYTGAMGASWAWLTGGLFFTFFCTEVGMTETQFGVLSGFTSFVMVAQLLSAHLTQTSGRRKLIWFILSLLDRTLRLAGILVALWLWRQGSAHTALFLTTVTCAATLFGAMAGPPWLSWLGDIIPRRLQGRFWGARSAWISAAVIAVLLPASYAMDHADQPHKISVVTGIFMVISLVGLLDIFIHNTIPDPGMPRARERYFLRHIGDPLRDPNFRPWLIFNACWNFALFFGGALCGIFFIRDLGIRNNFVGGNLAVGGCWLVGGLLTGSLSGKMVDRIGIIPVLFWGSLLWSVVPAMFIPATPATAIPWLAAAHLIGGVGGAAAANASTKLIVRLPTAEQRAMYIAVSTGLGSLAAGLGSLVSGWIFTQGPALRLWNNFSINTFFYLFAMSTILRLACVFLLLPAVGRSVNRHFPK